MVRQAAQGQVLHHDDTKMRVLALMDPHEKPLDPDPPLAQDRKGVFTSGIVSLLDGRA